MAKARAYLDEKSLEIKIGQDIIAHDFRLISFKISIRSILVLFGAVRINVMRPKLKGWSIRAPVGKSLLRDSLY